MPHVSGGWLTVLVVVALLSLIPVIWAVVDVLRRPAWQFSPGRKALWAITLGVGWLIGLYPLVVVSSVLYLAVLRRRLPSPVAVPPPPVTKSPAQAQPGVPAPLVVAPVRPADLPPAAWYPDPSGAEGERWWDGLGWTAHQRPYPA